MLPLDSLLVETDAPVLSPIRGERNEPANVIYAVKKIAELKDVSEAEVAETTTKNANSLFQLRT
jgi:TatD DNase family protein